MGRKHNESKEREAGGSIPVTKTGKIVPTDSTSRNRLPIIKPAARRAEKQGTTGEAHQWAAAGEACQQQEVAVTGVQGNWPSVVQGN